MTEIRAERRAGAFNMAASIVFLLVGSGAIADSAVTMFEKGKLNKQAVAEAFPDLTDEIVQLAQYRQRNFDQWFNNMGSRLEWRDWTEPVNERLIPEIAYAAEAYGTNEAASVLKRNIPRREYGEALNREILGLVNLKLGQAVLGSFLAMAGGFGIVLSLLGVNLRFGRVRQQPI